MVNTEALFIPSHVPSQTTFTLAQRISAIQLVATERGQARLGTITQLPPSARVNLCGDGFNERTVKVKYQDCFYFVFRQDLLVSTSQN
jgi:hypothetical protein